MEKVCFKTQKGPAAVGAVLHGDDLRRNDLYERYDRREPADGKVPEAARWLRRSRQFENIKTVLAELGADTGDVLKTTVFLTNIADFSEVNKLYAEVFGPDYPARTCVEVSALPMGLSIEVECIAKA